MNMSSQHSLVHTLPPEILSEIFGHLLSLKLDDVILAASVCRRWRELAIADTSLWLWVPITRTSITDPDTLDRILQRSKKRPLQIAMTFMHRSPTPYSYPVLQPLLNLVVKQLFRCTSLAVLAREMACAAISLAFGNAASAGETFPLLQQLYLVNSEIRPHWQVSSTEPAPVFFWLPQGHQLRECVLQGFSLGPYRLPNVHKMRIMAHSPNIIMDDGTLNPQFFLDPTILRIADICVPPLPPPTDTNTPADPAAWNVLKSLVLENLLATPVADDPEGGEHDCKPFFQAINTSLLLCLTIDSWNPNGRVTDDFVDAVSTGLVKFPRVHMLMVRRVDISEFLETTAAFLRAFPKLERLDVFDSPAWAADVHRLLDLNPDLCPLMHEVGSDTSVLLRSDGLPFRGYMYVHPPVEGCEYSWDWDNGADAEEDESEDESEDDEDEGEVETDDEEDSEDDDYEEESEESDDEDEEESEDSDDEDEEESEDEDEDSEEEYDIDEDYATFLRQLYYVLT